MFVEQIETNDSIDFPLVTNQTKFHCSVIFDSSQKLIYGIERLQHVIEQNNTCLKRIVRIENG